MSKYKTEQENFWSGEFGSSYTERNSPQNLLAPAINMFSQVLSEMSLCESIIEFGANQGINILALQTLRNELDLSAVEINPSAANKLREISGLNVHEQSILDFTTDKKFDLTFTRGVLIHINPEELPSVYEKLYEYSNRYIMVAEYYNPSPVDLPYRGHENKLFKRDFAGDLLDRYNDLKLVNYGFHYHRDRWFPQDDITWFLLEKC
jgi:spore coat polysaccharide biosynthesis protein SpsF